MEALLTRSDPPTVESRPPEAAAGSDFFARFRRPIRGQTKYAQLHDALVAAVESGYWQPGQRLPTEPEVVRATPFSLGTVQRAFRTLVAEGIVVRRPGVGTFVADPIRRMDDPWHFRFVDDEGTGYLPVYSRVLFRRRLTGKGAWSGYLPASGAAVIRIDRTVSINREFEIYSRFFIDESRFPAVMTKPLRDLDGANFKAILNREYNLLVTRLSYDLTVARFPADICKAIGLDPGASGLLLESVGRTGNDDVVYYQRVYVPPTRRKLRITNIGYGN